MRAFAAVPIAIAVCVAAPVFADASSHVTAAKRAERKSDWRKALQQWKAAYAAEPNAEYLIGIGDAYSHLGNKAEAKKNYEAYLADPLALPASVQKVKSKIAALEPPAGGALAAPTLPPLSGSGAATAAGKTQTAEAALPLPGLDLPTAAPPPAMPPLPGLELPGAAAAAKKGRKRSRPPRRRRCRFPAFRRRASRSGPKKDAVPAVADGAKSPAKPIAMVPPAVDSRSDKAPVAALSATPVPQDSRRGSSGGVQRTMAYVTAGVAVAALGGGALAFTKANSAQNDLTGGVHSSAHAQQLLDDVNRNKTLSVVGFAGGLVAAGIAAALFAF